MSFQHDIDSKPRPRITPDHKPFWGGLREHRLMIPYCGDCGKPHLPPGPVCPYCLSARLEWRACSGHGIVTTWVKVHRPPFPAFAAEIPYNVIQVELAEGPRITANLAVAVDHPITVGQPVVAVYDDIDERLTLLRFKPK